MSMLNPDIKVVNYGKKEIKILQVYPLSIRDQFKLTSMVSAIVMDIVAEQAENNFTDAMFMKKIMDAIESNLTEVLAVAADVEKEEADSVINSMTNTQMMDLIEIIWEVNYEPAIKKGTGLLERGRNLFPSRKSSAPSLSDTPSTD